MKENSLRFLLIFFLGSFFFGCGGGGGGGSVPAQNSTTPATVSAPVYTTSVTPVTSKNISVSQGGMVTVLDSGSLINGVRLTVPSGALSRDTMIGVGHVNNPPPLPMGLNYVGAPIDFGPDGTIFSKPGTVEIPFSDADMIRAGVLSKTGLKLFIFDKLSNSWSEGKIISIDTEKNVVVGQVDHFSFYSLVGLSGMQPNDLGRPQPADLIFKLTTYDKGISSGWVPGHVGMFVGEKKLPSNDYATPDAIRCGKYNVIEADEKDGVRRAYYKIPNTVQSCEVETEFSRGATNMGTREPMEFILTSEQRMAAIEFMEKQVGKPYATWQSIGAIFGLLDGWAVKGPDSFNCVGSIEKAYEVAGANPDKDGVPQGIVKYDESDLLTPAGVYRRTKPAGGIDSAPVIEWATLTPNSGTASTQVLAQISVSHPDGLDKIDSVRYVTDSGYVNLAININDAGVSGDLKAGDGIFSYKAVAGAKPVSSTTMGLTFVVTDKSGKSVSVKLTYTYTSISGGGYVEVAPKQIGDQLVAENETWAH